MLKKTVLFFSLLLYAALGIQAQQVIELRHAGDIYFHYGLKTEGETDIQISLGDRKFTGLIIETASKESLEDFQVAEMDGEYMEVTHDPHSPSKIGYKSNLIYFSGLTNSIRLKRSIAEDEVIYLHFINAYGDGHQPILNKRNKTEHCEKPEMIEIDSWRSGLPTPTATPVVHDYRHVVVHHTDGSNEPDDYRQVIRSIYIQHTQINGWDDIGYNFLIAGDGSIYEGRDPQAEGNIEDIRGAHFCGKNTGTLGIGVMGSFTNRNPTDEALESLKRLTTWALLKKDLTPLQNFPHPEQNSTDLGTFVGHRDGCATECPGATFYQILPELASDIHQMIADCSTTGIAQNQEQTKHFQLFPNPNNGQFEVQFHQEKSVFQSFSVYNFNGKTLKKGFLNGSSRQTFDFNDLPSGLYLLCFHTGQNSRNCQKLIIQ